ncbi:MAG: MarR family winged helix-turn-helix transcriptional regulator [Elusimicrobiota bacterium]
MENEEKKIASEINDLFLQLTEMLWEHVYSSHLPSRTVSFSITEHYLIEFLGKESFASMSKLSRIFHVPPTTMTSIVDRLVQRGYIKRHRAQQDRRKVLVTLSEKGKEFYLYHRYESLKVYAHYLSRLPDKGKNFRQSLIAIKQNIDYLKDYFKEI